MDHLEAVHLLGTTRTCSCGQTFESRAQILSHLRYSHIHRSYRCETCKIYFTNLLAVLEHTDHH